MSVEVSNDQIKATDLAKAVLGDPSQTVSLALQHVIDEFRSGAVTLTPPQVEDLKELIAAHEKNGMSPSSSPEVVKAGGKEITLDGSPAIEIHVQVYQYPVRTVLSDASFNMSFAKQKSYAKRLGGRLATREENTAVANALLEKERQGKLNPAEAILLEKYQRKWIHDSQGGIVVNFGVIYSYPVKGQDVHSCYGALFVLPIEQPIDADQRKHHSVVEFFRRWRNCKNGRSKNEDSSTPIASPLESERQNYDDARSGVAPHPAINFSVAVNSDVVAAVHLRELLGEDATVLMSDWGDRIDFTKNVPTSNKVTLLIDSNNKNRTTQGEDFKASGLEFADDLQATIVCAILVKKAKDAGLDLSEVASSWKENQSEAVSQLNEAELDLLTKLRDGLVRSRSGALAVDSDGRLRVFNDYDGGYRNRLAFGASPSAE